MDERARQGAERLRRAAARTGGALSQAAGRAAERTGGMTKSASTGDSRARIWPIFAYFFFECNYIRLP